VTFGGRSGLVLAMFATTWLVRQTESWRTTLQLYGGLGIVAAIVFWLIVRDRPASLVPVSAYRTPFPLRALVRSRMVWLASVHQFGINLAWAFLITEMPSFFTARYGVPETERGWVSTVPVAVGCFGMLVGGWLIDVLTRRYGLRIGRVVPLSGWLLIAAVAYGLTAAAPTAWIAAACFAAMAFAVDAANPAYWTFSQDIGKEHAAAALGWGNMIGNFGAALSPILLGYVQSKAGWTAMFLAGSLAFLMSATVAISLNPNRAIDQSGGGQPASR
jgi:ACS family glucarate transporter-like MFS transporter